MITQLLLKIIELLTKLIDLVVEFVNEDLRPLIHEFREYIREKRQAIGQLPEHMSVQEVADYLGKNRTSLYRGVIPDLLEPCKYIGNRPYFRKEDVAKVLEEFPAQEKHAHRFTKRKKGAKRK